MNNGHDQQLIGQQIPVERSFLTDPFATQHFPPKSLGVEPVEGGFIVSGTFAGTHRRCVAASVPALVKLLRAWSEQFKPKTDA